MVSGGLYGGLGLAETWDSVLWPMVYLPLMLVVSWLLLSLTAPAVREARRLVVVGLGLLVGAVALEVVTAPWSVGLNAVHTLQGGVEEAAELAGWTLLATAIWVAAIGEAIRRPSRPDPAPSPARPWPSATAR